jgi:hypothetical protein
MRQPPVVEAVAVALADAAQPGAVPPWEWRAGAPQTTGVIGNSRSHVYYKPSCRGAATMSERNHVTFANTAKAEKAGYRPARDCGRKQSTHIQSD